MIAATAISADALCDDFGLDRPGVAQLHEELTLLMLKHGLLVFSSDDAKRAAIAQLVELSASHPDAAKYWDVVLSNGRWMIADPPAPPPLEDVFDITELSEWKGLIEVAFMERVRAGLLGCPDDVVSHIDPASGIEVASFTALWSTEVFRALRSASERRAISVGTAREVIAERFEPLIDIAERITILDQWMGRGLAAHFRGNDRNTRSYLNSGPQELEWLLEKIDGRGEGVTVTLFTTHDPPGNAAAYTRNEIITALRTVATSPALRHGGITKLQAVVAPQTRRRQRFPHDRHIRFGEHGAFDLSAGLDRLRFDVTRDAWRLSYMWTSDDIQSAKRAENDARSMVPSVTALC
jgi:hypothetical protein